MKFISRKNTAEHVIIAITGQKCRIQHLKKTNSGLIQLAFAEFEFNNTDELKENIEQWCKKTPVKNILCRWVLSRDYYQTFQIDPPKVQPKEMDEAIKWQIKDLIESSLSDVLVSHYQPKQSENQTNQIVAVVVEKNFIESLIKITASANLEMETIDIEELSVGHSLLSYLDENKIVGFIGEDNNGLVFNFYNGNELSFVRHKKGRYLPNTHSQEFSLEQDKEALEESFLLETQRTLDYVVSQIFRKPVDNILLQKTSEEDSYLADILKQITEVEVTLVTPQVEQSDPSQPIPSLVETGAAMRQGS
ncbi:hypothetical protein [Aliikangiella sp. IMCC44359]|uniref:hypothetical protein n=1 Tax=Aliikangiella sp. IMCC44359 TaxID=3459125 RepID=UPI00403A980D